MLIKDIEIGKRMRHNMGDLTPLMESMSAIGQLQPVVIDDHSRLNERKEAERREREHAGRPKKGEESTPISGKGKSRDKVALAWIIQL